MRAAVRTAADLAGRLLIAGVVGVLAGVAGAAFLHSLDWAGDTFARLPWLLWLLPVAGIGVAASYHYLAGRAAGGVSLIIEEIHAPADHVPRRMAPLIFVTTVVTHLFGGSSGREGVAVQLAGSLSDLVTRWRRRAPTDRGDLLVVAIAAGFGAIFGTPVAGTVFALEVPTAGRLRLAPAPGCLVGALVGDAVARALRVEHTALVPFPAGSVDLAALGRYALLGVGCGLAALTFVWLLHAVKRQAGRLPWFVRPVVGGAVIVALVGIAGTRAYLGLSAPLAVAAVAGAEFGITAWAWKVVFTAVTLGTGFQGGEVTPLFVAGATLGSALAAPLGLPVGAAAAVGHVAVLGAAANTPVACTVLAVELFGGSALAPAAVACLVARLVSTRRSLYATQRHDGP
ncbi:MAG: chloride channel protein [Acidimicrobiales bacterium]